MLHFEKFLQVFVENQTTKQKLPKKLVHNRVISNNTINDWILYSAPPLLMALLSVSQSTESNSTSHRYREMFKACIEATTNEVQQGPYGDVVKYIDRGSRSSTSTSSRLKLSKTASLQHLSILKETRLERDSICRSLPWLPSMMACSSTRRSSQTVENRCPRRTMRYEKTVGSSSSKSTLAAFLDRWVCKI